MKSINIYCLVDPRNNLPFYVGATKQSINIRLSGHINEVKTYLPNFWSVKQKFMHQLLSEGKRPKTRLLLKVDIYEVDFYEKFFYDVFIKQGFTLLQLSHRFYYTSFLEYNKFYVRKNQQLVPYSHYCCNNIFGNK